MKDDFNVRDYLIDRMPVNCTIIDDDVYVDIQTEYESTTAWREITRIMEEMGFTMVSSFSYEDNQASFKLSDKEKITDDMEIIHGQDHTFWIYDNDRDAYYSTVEHWAYMEDDEFVERFNKIGFTLYGNGWLKDGKDFEWDG